MKIIIDGVFNHVGLTFWAFQDVIDKREHSQFYEWFNVEGSGLPDASVLNVYQALPEPFNTQPEIPMRYSGYVEDLPAFRQDESGPVKPIRDHLKAIISRWMDPNGDGDPSDGINGWRLDVAERLPLKFWNLFSVWVKTINPDAYITGEVWWEDYWNNKQFNAAPWLTDGRFDGIMNYRFGDAMFRFFIDDSLQISTTDLDLLLSKIRQDYGYEKTLFIQNVLDSHDMERLASAIVNPDRWMDHANNLRWNYDFDIRKPNLIERKIQKTIVAFQFAYPGTPYIYYGDEVGMWGGDDPDCRKPMVWQEFNYDDETTHPCDLMNECSFSRPVDQVTVDHDLFQFYHTIINFYHSMPAFRQGVFKTQFVDDEDKLFAFIRSTDDQDILAIFNGSYSSVQLPDDVWPDGKESWRFLFGNESSNILDAKDFVYFIRE
jgi:glycosidase